MRMKYLTPLLICIFAIACYAEDYTLKCTVKNHLDQIIPEANFSISDPYDNLYTGISDSCGQLTITVPIFTSIDESGFAAVQNDYLSGIKYNLASGSGQIMIYNILGQQIKHQDIDPGYHELNVESHWASGKYFIVMKTKQYHAISSFTLIEHRIIGIGKTVIKNNLASKDRLLTKNAVTENYHLIGYKEGYDSLSIDVDINQDFLDFNDELLMNQLPAEYGEMPDTLWSGVNLNLFVMNDDPGVWTSNSRYVNIVDGIVHIDTTNSESLQNIEIIYSDSINSNRQLVFNKTMQFHNENKTALVLVIENLGIGYDEILEVGFLFFHDAIMEILSDMFQIEEAEIDSMALSDIVDVYGEDWQINQLKNIGDKFYDKIVVLTDSNATYNHFLDSLSSLANDNYIIDMMFSLHGSYNCVSFFEDCYDIENVTSDIQALGCNIRALYQTCCYGSYMIDDWERINIHAVNGSYLTNSLAIFSPIYFLDFWTSGYSYEDAVVNAYSAEIEKLSSYDSVLPISTYMLTDDVLSNSAQITGGIKSPCYWLNANP